MSKRRCTTTKVFGSFTVLAVFTALLSSTATTAADAAASSPVTQTVPLASSFSVGSGSWATLAMGRLSEIDNTFWQQVVLPVGATKWTIETPPGVADNGGLVSAPRQSGVVIGFEPSQLLHFSPIATLPAVKRGFTSGVLSVALANVPDAVAANNFGNVFALARSGAVMKSFNGTSDWTSLRPSSQVLNIRSAHCPIQAVTALAAAPTNGSLAIIGTSCQSGDRIGLFKVENSAVPQLIGPTTTTGSPTKVLRLSATASGISALVASSSSNGATKLFVVRAKTITGPWSTSAVTSLAKSDHIVSSGIFHDGSFFVEEKSDGKVTAVVQGATGSTWKSLHDVPKTTAVLASGVNGAVDALVPSGKNLLIYQQAIGQQRFTMVQRLAVPIQYGSSG